MSASEAKGRKLLALRQAKKDKQRLASSTLAKERALYRHIADTLRQTEGKPSTLPVNPATRLSWNSEKEMRPDVPRSSKPNMTPFAGSNKAVHAIVRACYTEEEKAMGHVPTSDNFDAFYRRHANIAPEEKDMTIHHRPAVPLQGNGIPLRGHVYAPTLGHYAPSEKKNK